MKPTSTVVGQSCWKKKKKLPKYCTTVALESFSCDLSDGAIINTNNN